MVKLRNKSSNPVEVVIIPASLAGMSDDALALLKPWQRQSSIMVKPGVNRLPDGTKVVSAPSFVKVHVDVVKENTTPEPVSEDVSETDTEGLQIMKDLIVSDTPDVKLEPAIMIHPSTEREESSEDGESSNEEDPPSSSDESSSKPRHRRRRK